MAWVSQKKDGDGKTPHVLVTGSLGQIGVELVPALRAKFGGENVVASDLFPPKCDIGKGPFEVLDVTNREAYEAIIEKYKIDWVIHNAALLSGTGEKNVPLAMAVNIRGVEIALELARIHGLRIYVTSSIAAFGPDSEPKDMMPDVVAMRPTTIYGVSKVYAELLGEYYNRKFGVDFRCLRFPGIISWKQCPSGGTTDYSTEMFYFALQGREYICPLKEDTPLPMMYMADALNSTIGLLCAPNACLKRRVYNVGAFSLTPRQVELAIKKEISGFVVHYKPDFRQQIAESWPHSLDDHNARDDWQWNPQFSAEATFADMLANLRAMFTQQK